MPCNAGDIYPSPNPDFVSFRTRRSVVHSVNGIVACTQPLAAEVGQRILRAGGNAADAAVAVAAALGVTEPTNTGVGGDMFCLFYDAAKKEVKSFNGSGRSPGGTSLEQVRREIGSVHGQRDTIPMGSVHAATTPGTVAGWIDTVERFGSGKLSLQDIFEPAIELSEHGFPVSEISSWLVRRSSRDRPSS